MENTAFVSGPYIESRRTAIHNALNRWRTGWPETLLDFEPCPESPALYQDRADAYWYLVGIIMLPHVAIASPRKNLDEAPRALLIEQILERLTILSDQGRLHGIGEDFEAVYRLVAGYSSAQTGVGALSTLLYPEADMMRTGFEE
jgi:hypothetical protein